MLELYPYQHTALAKVGSKLNEGINRQVVKLPTGMGKTPLFAKIDVALGPNRKRKLVIVHREELASQCAETIARWNPGAKVGVEMGELRSNQDEEFIVAGVRTIGNAGSPRLTQFDPGQFISVGIDECHHATAQSYQTVMNHFKIYDRKDILLLGVTATPNRTDGSPLGTVFEEIVYEKSILEGIQEGYLSNLRGVKIVTGESLDDVHRSMGDFVHGELAGKVDTARMNDLAARSWLEHGEGRQTVEFCVDVAHAKNLATAYKGYGVPAEAIWADDKYRAEKLAAHRAGQLKVITNCEILIEGYDDWRIGCIGLSRPTQSELLYTQMIGRGTRIDPATGNLVAARAMGLALMKEDCLILDRVYNTSKHSLVTLASLFGLGMYTDLKKRGMAKIMEEVAEMKSSNPALDLSKLLDINDLKSYAKSVDMFSVSYPPEIEKISPYQWRKVDDAYVLLLHNKSSVTVLPDLLDKWHVCGVVNGYKVNESVESLEEAVKTADQSVKDLGTREMQLFAKRVLKGDFEKPSAAQIALCKKLHIPVPPTASKGEVRRKIGQVLGDKTKRRVA